MINKILNDSKENKSFIGVRFYNDDDNFWCGYIEDFNDTIFQMRHFDKHGNEDGVIIGIIENIDSIDINQDYQQTFNYITRKKYDFDSFGKIVEFKDTETWRKEYLNSFLSNNEIISFELKNEYDIYGKISILSENEIIVQTIENHGESLGTTLYKLEDISALKFGDIESKFRKSLYDWRKKTCG